MIPHIMDIFRTGAPLAPQNTVAPGATAPNGVVPPQNIPSPENNLPPQNTPQKEEKKEPAPLEPFSKLWDPPTAEEIEKQNKNSGIDFENVDPAKMMEAAKKVDFTQILTPEMQQAIAKGGEEGMKATLLAMNAVNQLSYGQSALAASKMIGAAVRQAKADVSAQIPALVKAAVISSNLEKSNPLFQNPAVKPIVDGLKRQLLTKFPDSTDAQLTEMAQQYFGGVASELGFTKPVSNSSSNNSGDAKGKKKNMTGKGEENWEDFFNS